MTAPGLGSCPPTCRRPPPGSSSGSMPQPTPSTTTTTSSRNLQHIHTNGTSANLVTPMAVTPSTGPSSFVLRSLPTRKATPGCCDNSQLCPTQTSEDFSHMEQPTLDSRSFPALRDGGSLPRPRPARLRAGRKRTQSQMVQPRLPPPYTRALTTSATTTTTSSPTWRRRSAAYVQGPTTTRSPS
jgi:hypothetical protein